MVAQVMSTPSPPIQSFESLLQSPPNYDPSASLIWFQNTTGLTYYGWSKEDLQAFKERPSRILWPHFVTAGFKKN